MKKPWKKTYEYQRILEILDDYWGSEPDEKEVDVEMYFLKGDGQKQFKKIHWQNPKYIKKATRPLRSLALISIEDIEEESILWEKHFSLWVNPVPARQHP